jgi:AcrR family transcriptional regulator
MRRKQEGRLLQIADAAIDAFTHAGYRLTQMADVAGLAGLSAAALYGYVEDKAALLHAAIARAFGALDPYAPLPYRIDGVEETLALIKHQTKERARWPALAAALSGDPADPETELLGICTEFHAIVGRERRAIWLLERCAEEVPEIAAFYNNFVRRRYYRDFSKYVQSRIALGRIEPLTDPDVASRAVIELMAWLGMHRHRDLFGAHVNEEVAAATLRELVPRLLRPRLSSGSLSAKARQGLVRHVRASGRGRKSRA